MSRKLDKEHLEEIQTLRNEFAKNSNALGSIVIDLHMLNRQLEIVTEQQNKYLNQFESLREQEQELLDKMRERYGEGQINLAEGTFIPESGLAQ